MPTLATQSESMQTKRMLFLRPLVLLGLAAASVSHAASPNENARFLAGLPIPEGPMTVLGQKSGMAEHAAALNGAWNSLQKRQLEPIATWRQEFLPTARDRALFYFFSGPDILYAHAFFPDAPVYILCGIEPVGGIPDVEKVHHDRLYPAMRQMRKSLESVFNWSFFKTKDMKVDFEGTPLRGITPILYLFLSRMGCHLHSTELVSVDRDGNLLEEKIAGSAASGIRITFTRPGQTKEQTVYYFCSDLSEAPVSKSGFLKWCDAQGAGDSFVKSASYLMHSGNFATTRKFLLEHSERLLSDDSGIPLQYFAENQWNLSLFGVYLGPISLFKEYNQPNLAAKYKLEKTPPLPFGFGYQWRSNQSTVMLAKKAAR